MYLPGQSMFNRYSFQVQQSIVSASSLFWTFRLAVDKGSLLVVIWWLILDTISQWPITPGLNAYNV